MKFHYYNSNVGTDQATSVVPKILSQRTLMTRTVNHITHVPNTEKHD